jgi:hypothetical protein
VLVRLPPSLFVVAALIAAGASLAAQPVPARDTDLDRFMAAVLARRDDNWKKLQQYILDERERVQVVGPVSDEERRRREADWLRREQRREQRLVDRERKEAEAAGTPAAAPPPSPEGFGDVLRQQAEPSFVRAAYFLRFKFESGRYALAGKEDLNGREVLRVEYYPARLFNDDGDKTRPERRAEQVRRRGRDDDGPDDERIQQQMNKTSLVTLWILRDQRQIVRYVFDNIDFGFLPGRSVARVDDLQASMTMAEAFPGIWLPQRVEARMAMAFAPGTVGARYDIAYSGYKEAGVTVRVR